MTRVIFHPEAEAEFLSAARFYVVKPVIATVAKDLVVRNLGRLSEKDRRGLEEGLRSILGE